MKRLLLVPCLLLTVLAVPVTVAAPAHAKGATDVVVSGPGIDDVKLGYTRRMDDVDVGSLAEVSGIYMIYGSGAAGDDPGLTTAELGPHYVLTWYAADTVMTVSHVYPFTPQGAWMHIPDDDGGWVRGGPVLHDAMVELGATRPVGEKPAESTDAAATTSDDQPAAAASSTDDSSSGSGAVTGVLVASIGLLLAAGAWLVRRRRTLQPA
jgi:hypothetical protein